MEASNIFEIASRMKLRFLCGPSLIDTEDVWDLSLEKLDKMYRDEAEREETLSKKGNGLLETASTEDDEILAKTHLRMDIIKRIFNVKKAEKDQRAAEERNKQRKKELMDILAEKEEGELRGKSKEEIMKMIEELN